MCPSGNRPRVNVWGVGRLFTGKFGGDRTNFLPVAVHIPPPAEKKNDVEASTLSGCVSGVITPRQAVLVTTNPWP